MLGPFRIGRPLGRGGMAAVYEARDLRLDRAVALKILPAEFLHDQTFARRFETEARLIARLEHRNIVPIYASGIDEGIPWMSMRLLTGDNLGVLLAKRRPEPAEAVRLLREVAAALDYAHALGVVHRDIKPANILLDGSGTPCVADFGLAQMMGAGNRLTQTGVLTGTPHYMAPEQALAKPVDHRCDIYSLGIVAYEMLVGTVPFNAESPIAVLMQHVHESLPAPPEPLSASPWMDVIRKAAAKDPSARWNSASAFVEALGASIGAGPPHRNDGITGMLRRASRSKVLWALGSAALVGTLWLVWVREPEAPAPSAPAQRADINLPAAPAPPLEPDTRASTTSEVKPTTPVRAPNPTASRPPAISTPDPQASQSAQESAASVPSPQAGVPTVVAGVPVTSDPMTTVPGAATPSPRAPDVLTEPERIGGCKPPYPPAAIAAGLEGEVVLSGVVGADGKVRDVTIERAVHPLLAEAARKAWLKCPYKPARRNGVPEAARIKYPVRFTFDERPIRR